MEFLIYDFEVALNVIFQLIRIVLDLHQPINAQMMTPVQRITRYPLLLRDAAKNFQRSGDFDCEATIMTAQNLASEIADYSNDMMVAGKMNNFPVSSDTFEIMDI